ncbi:hypothetical protein QE152_g4084 [Popillia japonica]|uniref:Uncharacterized protein n=1 Tax=Popillia japonica TaxID=7064 RepID=A0AAW1N1W5_POPJA
MINSFGIIRLTNTNLSSIEAKTRTEVTKPRTHHPHNSEPERLHLPRRLGGGGIPSAIIGNYRQARSSSTGLRTASELCRPSPLLNETSFEFQGSYRIKFWQSESFVLINVQKTFRLNNSDGVRFSSLVSGSSARTALNTAAVSAGNSVTRGRKPAGERELERTSGKKRRKRKGRMRTGHTETTKLSQGKNSISTFRRTILEANAIVSAKRNEANGRRFYDLTYSKKLVSSSDMGDRRSVSAQLSRKWIYIGDLFTSAPFRGLLSTI